MGRNRQIPNYKRALVIEWFANGKSMKQISGSLKLSIPGVSKIIGNDFFYKKRSYDTITLVLDSKLNYQ